MGNIFGNVALARLKFGSVSKSTAVGEGSMDINGTVLQYSTAFGYNALKNNVLPEVGVEDGKYNSAFGHSALTSNTTGDHCTAVGYGSLMKNTTGDKNTGTGEDSLSENTIGYQNTAFGNYALKQSTEGNMNTACGANALLSNTTGTWNTAVGFSTGEINYGSIGACITDTSMTFLGALAGVDKTGNSTAQFTKSTAVGFAARVNKSYMVKLGGTDVTSVETNGSYECLDIGDGFICKSPNGTRYKITVADGGGSVVIAAV